MLNAWATSFGRTVPWPFFTAGRRFHASLSAISYSGSLVEMISGDSSYFSSAQGPRPSSP